ncbi:NERD domain-containing protein [Deinococcus sp. HMF7604]|uniref:nuclease-related domain-containing protein n=1 Tax=Deinococcus betulae TaxID=2873312 RepID=UPI001CC9F01E|nr:nuclease-related domain-containing protein [Deinococcus betulae]MBZ9750321.1 NERD domain-containing protein [Deinococcus betulae]
MIVKELEPQQFTDPLRRAGYEAERQMAFYLKRAFGEDPRKFVFHNLRLERKGEVAQLDHLVLHRYGLVVVESKSVAGQVSINEQGEWTRWWNRQGRGMASPVLQARRQLDLLLALLTDHTTELMDRSLLGLKQRTFSGVRRDVLVAISDGGRITRKRDVPELVKADQIPDRVKSLIEREAEKTFGTFGLTEAELTRIQAFLRAQHTPAEAAPEPPQRSASGAPVRTSQERQAQARPQPPVRCRDCQSTHLSVQYGKYSYYLKCGDCSGNTPAKPVCGQCGQPARLSKAGLQFTATCSGGHRWPYWTNPG